MPLSFMLTESRRSSYASPRSRVVNGQEAQGWQGSMVVILRAVVAFTSMRLVAAQVTRLRSNSEPREGISKPPNGHERTQKQAAFQVFAFYAFFCG